MTSPSSVRIVFLGSPAFAVPSLRALQKAGYTIAGVVTQPGKRAGRGGRVQEPAVRLAAAELGIEPVLQPETLREPAPVEAIASLHPDILVVAAYGKILPKSVLAIPTRGSVNVHASLLPRWRGASPIESAILEGDGHTGVTIMEVVQKMDAGPIVSSVSTPIRPDDTTATLEPRLAELGARLLVESLPGWCDGTIRVSPQDEAEVTYCTLIQKEHGRILADTDLTRAERMVRAYNPWPTASIGYGDERLAIWGAHAATSTDEAEPGRLTFEAGELRLALNGGWLALDEVQRPGGKRLSGRDFVNGERGRGGLRSEAVLT